MLVQLMGWNLCHLQKLLIRKHLVLIKHEEKEHLVAGAEELVSFAFAEKAAQLCITKSQFPIQEPSIVVLAVVELSKRVHGDANFVWNLLQELGIFLVIWPVTLSEYLDLEVDSEALTS